MVMQQFLEYSRQLTMEEMEMAAVQDPKGPARSPPKMEQFREQIDLYEGLYLEIEEMEPSKVFCGWFRVDLRPFRQSVLNTVCKWSSMFKRHLVDRVTSSLSDLGSFIRFFFSCKCLLATYTNKRYLVFGEAMWIFLTHG